jgi:competence protein ComEC
LAAAVLGFVLGTAYWTNSENTARTIAQLLDEHPQQSYTLDITEDYRQGTLSKTSVARLSVAGAGHMAVRIYWDEQQKPLALGTRLTARVVLKPLTENQAFLHQRGVLACVSLQDIAVEGFPQTPLGYLDAFREHNRQQLAAISGQGSLLLRGILLGETSELNSSEAGRWFRVTGLSHLVAVSGSHLVVIALVISWLLKRLRLKRALEVALVTVLLVSYVFLTGLQPSAIRACVMTLIVSVAPFFGRRRHAPSAVAAAAVGMLLLSPPTAFSMGFWLSVDAVFGLTIFCPLITKYLSCLLPAPGALRNKGCGGVRPSTRGERVLGMARRTTVEPFALTVTAQLATMPITAPTFATVPLVSPLANLLVTPFVTLLVGAGIPLLCLMPFLGPVGPHLLSALCAITQGAITVTGWCAQLPYASLPVALDPLASGVCALLVAAALYIFWPQPSRGRCLKVLTAASLVALLLFGSSFLPLRPQVVMLDIGQGDALLIREGRSTVLVDTGQSDTVLLRALARQRVSHLDAVVLTHLDVDHCGGLPGLIGSIPVDRVFFAEGLLAAKPSDEAIVVAKAVLRNGVPEELGLGDTLTLGRTVQLAMLWPSHTVTEGGNAESICLGLSYDADADGAAESRMLLTGDAEKDELDGLLSLLSDTSFDSYKVGHHGSKKAVTVDQLEQMGCSLAFISVGATNRYGHPTLETLDVLAEAGVTVYRTDLNGDVTLSFSNEKLIVRCDTITDGFP